MSPDVRYARDGHVAVLTLDRPGALNALSRALMDEAAARLDEAAADETVRAVVLTGAGRAFCAGADIGELQDIAGGDILAPGSFPGRLFDVLTRFRKPLIAAVEGPALGGGCELALACDITIAGETARFGLPEVTLGVIPGAGGTQRLMTAIGKPRAMRMLLSGEPVTSTEALAAGLVAEVVPAGTALDTAVTLARRIAANAPLAVQMAKDAALAGQTAALEAGLAHERRNFYLLLGSDDRREGTAAFLAKRPPVYTGR